MTDATPMRRCIGSRTFGIEAHEAPASDFPIQPSQKDGLGRMCKTDWNRYTNGLRKAALARKAGGEPAVTPGKPTPAKAAAKSTGRAPKTKAPSAAKPDSPKVRRAREVVAATEPLGGEAYTDAVGSDEAQSALEVIAGGRGDAVEVGSNELAVG